MRLLPSDPDVETIVSRIRSGDIDLQPDFQRGEVWGKPKKQRLVDSILRDWHVPPIHVIESSKAGKQEVLDGQQRLASIRDFVDGEFPVDGTIEPLQPEIQVLNGKRYEQLPKEWKRKFNQFTIRVFRIVDYGSSEPAELFFRLNQPTSLTGAEQRNAFFGPVRAQIKELVRLLENKSLVGFSNSRMSYDDVLSRAVLAVERGTLAEKITSSDLAALYRNDHSLGERTIGLVGQAIDWLTVGEDGPNRSFTKFNKATLFSWLIFLVRCATTGNIPASGSEIGHFLHYFERLRNRALHEHVPVSKAPLLAGRAPAFRLFATYETRSSARVADVSSVILRDSAIWLSYEDFCSAQTDARHLNGLRALHEAFDPSVRVLEDDMLARKLIDAGWGRFT